jgi:DNA-binding NtrC family response regulator
VRVVATSNRDLEAEVGAGRFREDLFYRLNVIPIRLPTLRDRRADIPALVEHYLAHFANELARSLAVDDDALALLAAYRWPGNVRELVNVCERLAVLADQDHLDAVALRRLLPELDRPGMVESSTPAAAGGGSRRASAARARRAAG